MTDETPIPDGDRHVAGVLTELRIEPYMNAAFERAARVAENGADR